MPGCSEKRTPQPPGQKTEAIHGLGESVLIAVHDALVTRLVLTRQTTDAAMGMLVRRFPAVERSSSRASDGAC